MFEVYSSWYHSWRSVKSFNLNDQQRIDDEEGYMKITKIYEFRSTIQNEGCSNDYVYSGHCDGEKEQV